LRVVLPRGSGLGFVLSFFKQGTQVLFVAKINK
jgi:hypothetical protein